MTNDKNHDKYSCPIQSGGTMDTKRSQAVLGLFSPEGVPSEEHLTELKKAPKIKKGEEDNLFQMNVAAFNNFKAWSKDHLAYIEQMQTTRQKVFLQRFLGIPEDAMPNEDSLPAQPVRKETEAPKLPPPQEKGPSLDELSLDGEDDGPKVPKPKPVKPHAPPKAVPKKERDPPQVEKKPEPDDRQIALSHLFDKSSKSHLKKDVIAIGIRFRPEPGDALVLPHETVEQMRLFAEDREGYIEAINSRTRPDLSESHIEYLRLLLGLLMDTGQKPETDPMDGPPLEPAPILEVKFKPKVSPPEWARKVMSNPYWDTARTRIELAFENMKSSDLAVRMDGMESLDRWQQRMREHKEGSSGKELVLFGDYMLTVIRVLRMGANPKSPEYKHMYSIS